MDDLIVRPPQETSIVKHELFDAAPETRVEFATKIANILKDVIDRQGFKVKVGAGEHVKCEGWLALGALLGITARELFAKELDDGAFEACVELISKNGQVVGRGSGYVGMDEPSWKNKPKYARRSMAITRATSRAYRNGFAWIIELAGYKATPAEEMESISVTVVDRPKSTIEFYTKKPHQKKELALIFEEMSIPKDLQKDFSERLYKENIQWDSEKIRTAIIGYSNNVDVSDIEIPFGN